MSQSHSEEDYLASGSSVGERLSQTTNAGGLTPENLLENSPVIEECDFHCKVCGRTLKTLRGFRGHKARHIQLDQQSKVSEELLMAMAPGLGEGTLNELLKEPFVGDTGRKRQETLRNLKSNNSKVEWGEFVFQIASKSIEIILNRTKIMPVQQHEENSKKFKQWFLECHDSLVSSLQKVFDCDLSIINCVIYRFCFKYFEAMQVLCVQLMRKECVSSQSVKDLTYDEKETLVFAAGSILKGFIWKGKKFEHSNVVWKERLKCIRERFLFQKGDGCSEEFRELMAWLNDINRGGLVMMSERVYKFFIAVERIIRSLCKDDSVILKAEDILTEVYKVENEDVLNTWYSLTVGFMGESSCLSFLDLTISKYTNFSGRAEVDLRLRVIESQKKLGKVALRTHLKRD